MKLSKTQASYCAKCGPREIGLINYFHLAANVARPTGETAEWHLNNCLDPECKLFLQSGNLFFDGILVVVGMVTIGLKMFWEQNL